MWSQDELGLLSRLTGVINCFSTDTDDEFTVVREDGRVQGIFKTWAAPVIPFLDLGGLEILGKAWPLLTVGAGQGLTFEESLNEVPQEVARQIVGTIKRWVELCRDNPDFFRRSLTRVVNYTFEIDRLLLKQYDANPLDPDPKKQVGQLLNRFRTALGLMGPFYHLEVIVANQTSMWAVMNEEDVGEGGGELDALAFFLPAIFARESATTDLGEVFAECKVRTRELLARTGPKSNLLWRISKAFGLDPVEIVFASQGLQNIPVRVGGKKEDLPEETALARVKEILKRRNGDDGLVSIARDVNAEIRFNNWVLSEEPVAGRVHARYGSVCEPIRQLRQVLTEHPEFWKASKLSVFNETIAGQIANLDAESAQGRLLWTLLVTEGWLEDEIYPLTDEEELVADLDFARPLQLLSEKVQGARKFGDKGANLSVVAQIKPLGRASLEGWVLDSMTVDGYLLKPLEEQIRRLVESHSLVERLAIAQEVREGLDDLSVVGLKEFLAEQFASFGSSTRWAVRSSCFGEDDSQIPSAGIYQSQLDVSVSDLAGATVETVKSWFCETAVHHRYLVGQSNLPLVAVVYQPYVSSIGGVVEVRDQEPCVTVYSSAKPSMVTSGGKTNLTTFTRDGLDGDDPLSQAAIVACDLAKIFGEIDIEWVFGEGVTKVLQLKVIRSVVREVKKVDSWVNFDPQDLPTFERRLQENSGVYGLVLTRPVDLERFQGDLFGVIARNGTRIGAIKLRQPVTSSCHFANICSGHGITLEVVHGVGE